MDKYGCSGFEVTLGGDCELETMIRALKFITKVLEDESGRCMTDEHRPHHGNHPKPSRGIPQDVQSPAGGHQGHRRLTREISEAEYEPVARMFAKEVG
jgi:hypothetical protein